MRVANQQQEQVQQVPDGVLQIVDDGQLTSDEMALRKSPAVQAIQQGMFKGASLDSNQMKEEIMAFGSIPAEKLSTFADRILAQTKVSDVTKSSQLMQQLGKLMQQFDMKDFQEEKKGFFAKLFKDAKDVIEKMLAKYQTVGGEIDKINHEIIGYQKSVNESNRVLEALYGETITYFQDLGNYIAAGNIVLEELKRDDLPVFEANAAGGDAQALIELNNMRQIIDMLEKRIYDLELARTVAMQTAPQIRMMQKGNYGLIMKIQSAFVTTIPLFKMGLVQAIEQKRQKLVADGMTALDEAAEKVHKQVAAQTAQQSIDIARLNGKSAISVEALEDAWKTILHGIEETERIEKENAQKRQDGLKRIHALQNDFKEEMKKRAI